MDVDLNEDATIQLDGTGAGTVRLGPTGAGEVWSPALASVKVSSNTNEATCKIYNGDRVIDGNFTDGTFSGSSGDSTDRIGGPLHLGNYIYAVWAGGDANAVATLNVSGTRSIP